MESEYEEMDEKIKKYFDFPELAPLVNCLEVARTCPDVEIYKVKQEHVLQYASRYCKQNKKIMENALWGILDYDAALFDIYSIQESLLDYKNYFKKLIEKIEEGEIKIQRNLRRSSEDIKWTENEQFSDYNAQKTLNLHLPLSFERNFKTTWPNPLKMASDGETPRD